MSDTPKRPWTPGPWRWEINLKGRRIQLCGGTPRYDWSVMTFERWGTHGATVSFLSGADGGMARLITPAREFAAGVPGREHHSDWFQTIDQPDAHLIAAAPDLYEALEALVDAYASVMHSEFDMAQEWDESSSEELVAARAALAKARGGAL